MSPRVESDVFFHSCSERPLEQSHVGIRAVFQPCKDTILRIPSIFQLDQFHCIIRQIEVEKGFAAGRVFDFLLLKNYAVMTVTELLDFFPLQLLDVTPTQTGLATE